MRWLKEDLSGTHRYAAVLILKEMAQNAPAIFNVNVSSFLERIWVGLRDPKLLVREAAVGALRVRNRTPSPGVLQNDCA